MAAGHPTFARHLQMQESEKAEFKINCPQPFPTQTPTISPEPFESARVGNVRAADGTVPPGTRIYLEGEGIGRLVTTPDTSGNFQIRLPTPSGPPRPYRLVFSAPGYRTYSQFVTQRSAPINVRLENPFLISSMHETLGRVPPLVPLREFAD